MKPLFETGATSHAVNDLILFTENTRELAALRDKIYYEWAAKGNPYGHEWTLADQFSLLLEAAIKAYCKEFPNEGDHSHILIASSRAYFAEAKEYVELYASDFENWKKDNL